MYFLFIWSEMCSGKSRFVYPHGCNILPLVCIFSLLLGRKEIAGAHRCVSTRFFLCVFGPARISFAIPNINTKFYDFEAAFALPFQSHFYHLFLSNNSNTKYPTVPTKQQRRRYFHLFNDRFGWWFFFSVLCTAFSQRKALRPLYFYAVWILFDVWFHAQIFSRAQIKFYAEYIVWREEEVANAVNALARTFIASLVYLP